MQSIYYKTILSIPSILAVTNVDIAETTAIFLTWGTYGYSGLFYHSYNRWSNLGPAFIGCNFGHFFSLRVVFVHEARVLPSYCCCFSLRFFFFSFLALSDFLNYSDFSASCLAKALALPWSWLGEAAPDFWTLLGWLSRVFFISFNSYLPRWQRWSKSWLF